MRARTTSRAVLGARLQPLLERRHARRQDEDRDEIVAHTCRELLRPLPVDIADDVGAGVERAHHRRARRAVAIAEDHRVLEQLALGDHLVERARG